MQDIQEFVNEVKNSGYLEMLGAERNGQAEDDYVIVRNSKDGNKYKILLSTIYEYDWNNISRVLNGGQATVLDQVTRIVGYFSKTSNWNKSKLGELNDRRKGNYKVK